MKKNHVYSITFSLISILLMTYLIMVVVPFAEKYNFMSEGSDPVQSKVGTYVQMTIPFLVGYLVLFALVFKKLSFIRCVNYPLTLVVIYFLSFASMLTEGGTMLWLMVFTLLPFIAILILAFVFGLKRDIANKAKG